MKRISRKSFGPFLLTSRLLPLLRRAAADAPRGTVRIINTSSDASEMIKGIPWDNLQSGENYNPGAAYCYGKLANVLFARGLSQRLADDGIVAHAMHPGVVDSNFITHADERTQAHIRTFKSQTPEEGADTLIWLATAEEPGRSTGGYFYQRKPRTPNPSLTMGVPWIVSGRRARNSLPRRAREVCLVALGYGPRVHRDLSRSRHRRRGTTGAARRRPYHCGMG